MEEKIFHLEMDSEEVKNLFKTHHIVKQEGGTYVDIFQDVETRDIFEKFIKDSKTAIEGCLVLILKHWTFSTRNLL